MDKEQNPGFLTAISLYILIAATTTAAVENMIYVKQGATGNGTTWANAYGKSGYRYNLPFGRTAPVAAVSVFGSGL